MNASNPSCRCERCTCNPCRCGQAPAKAEAAKCGCQPCRCAAPSR